MESSIRALIFDMDGLLVDSESLAESAMQRFLASHGVEMRPEVQSQLLGRRLPEAVALVAEAYQMRAPREDLIRSYDELRLAALRGNVKSMPGAHEIVIFARAAGLRLALATSGMRRHADLSLQETGLAGKFDVEVTGDDVEHGKPAPDLFLLAANRLGLEPDDCVVLEDAPPGVAAAVSAGMRVIAVPNAKSRSMTFPIAATAVLPDLHAAIEWLRDRGIVSSSVDTSAGDGRSRSG